MIAVLSLPSPANTPWLRSPSTTDVLPLPTPANTSGLSSPLTITVLPVCRSGRSNRSPAEPATAPFRLPITVATLLSARRLSERVSGEPTEHLQEHPALVGRQLIQPPLLAPLNVRLHGVLDLPAGARD